MSKSQPVVPDRRKDAPGNAYRRSIFSVPVSVTFSIGNAKMAVSEILNLHQESIVPLSTKIDDPIDICIDNKVIARGELIETSEGSLGVKITEIMEQANYAGG